MQDLRREGCGAILTERCNSLVDIRARGTVTSLPYIVAGPRGGRATLFDGTDDKVSIPVNRSMNSFVLWVYFASITEEVADFDGGGHILLANAGTLAATGWTTPTIYVDGVATTTITTGWHHIAVTTGTAFTCTTLQLGTDNNGFGAVRIADVSLWVRVLSAAEVLQEAQGTTWDYDLYEEMHLDGSTINPPDVGHKGNGYDFTGTGLVASTDIVTCPYGGYAVDLNGSDEYLERVAAGWRSTDLMGAVSCLFRRNSTGVWIVLLGSCDTATDENFWLFGVSAANNLVVSVEAAGVPITTQNGTTTVIASGEWRHGVLSSDGSAYSMYVDGIVQSIVTSVGTNTGEWLGDVPLRDSVTVGCRKYNATDLILNGAVADLRYYSQPLTNIQAADLYRRLTGGR